MSGHYRPDAGEILFEGRDLAHADAHAIARGGIARTYQIPRPFAHLTVRENVAMAAMFGGANLSRAAAEREARHWLEFTGLAAKADALPDDLNLHQRKFLELARALASRPRLVLLDEVLSGLTPTEINERGRPDPRDSRPGRDHRLRRARHARGQGAGRSHRRAQPRAGHRRRPRRRCHGAARSRHRVPRGAAMLEARRHRRRDTAAPPRCGTSRSRSRPAELVCVVGPNGAGKSTLINVIAGLHRISRRDRCWIGDCDLARLPAHRFCAEGIAIVPEGRRLFAAMTVRENLELGSYRAAARAAAQGFARARLCDVSDA